MSYRTMTGAGNGATDLRILYDTFTGSGALTAHTPDIYPVGSSWAIKAGTFANLSGGQLPYTTDHNGVAIINIGVTDFDAICVLTAVAAANHNVGLCVRSIDTAINRYLFSIDTAVGSVATGKYTALGTYTGTLTAETAPVWPVIGAGEHTLRLICTGNTFRVGINGTIYLRSTDASYAGTYIGPGCYWGTTAGMKWNSLTVYSLPAFRNFTVLGDSISTELSGLGTWPNWTTLTMWNYGDGYSNQQNHAVSGQSIITHMDAQVVAAAGDTPSFILCNLGTNDDNAGNMVVLQAELEENLAELAGDHPGVPIYYLNVLPRWTDATGVTEVAKGNVRAAIAAGCAAQGVTCWDSYTVPWITAADTVDGLHPTAAGSWKIANEALARIP